MVQEANKAASEIQDKDMVKFTMEKPEFDQDTYWGRFEGFRAVANPLNAFCSNGQITEMRALLDSQKEREATQMKTTGSSQVLMSQENINKVRRA